MGEIVLQCDLHVHTTMSDGSVSPAQVVRQAKRGGLTWIAISDHDTFDGVQPARDEGAKLGVNVIEAVEISSWDSTRKRPVHILCYCPANRDALEPLLSRTRDMRRKQKLLIIEKVAKRYPIDEALVSQYVGDAPTICDMHIMHALADLGYTNSVMSPFKTELLDKGGDCYVPAEYPCVYEVLDSIRQAKGMAVMAHPSVYDSMELLAELAKTGRLDGIELDHPRNTSRDREHIRRLEKHYGLLMTGGSDFHGSYARNPHPIGSFGCGVEVARALQAGEERWCFISGSADSR